MQLRSKRFPLHLTLFTLLLGPAVATVTGCGGTGADSDIQGLEGMPPLGGRSIKFQSTYVYFPSDFGMALVRDTMPQDDACRILQMYARSRPPLQGLPVLPYEKEHYALVISIDTVHTGDLSIYPDDHGDDIEQHYAILAQYPAGRNLGPTMHWPAGGLMRITDITQYQHVSGEFRLQFPAGEHIEQTFDVTACQ